MRELPRHITRRQSFDARAEDTAAAVGNVGVEAVATVAMILWVEETCGNLIQPYLAPGEASVGLRVALDHKAPAFAGRPVQVEAQVVVVQGPKVTFRVRLEQDGREVMAGEHRRAVVELERFLAGRSAPRERPALPPVTFWFDVHSPWCYLASHRIGALTRRYGAELLWRPLHLARLMERIGGLQPLDQSPARVAWYRQDLRDRLAQAGLAYAPHPDYPLRPSRALRACLYADQQGLAEPFVQAVMEGYWAARKDISDPAVLQDLADLVGLGPRPIAAVIEDEDLKQAIADNTAEAADGGIFGVPSFLFEGKLYFGNDHLDLLESALARFRPEAGGTTRP